MDLYISNSRTHMAGLFIAELLRDHRKGPVKEIADQEFEEYANMAYYWADLAMSIGNPLPPPSLTEATVEVKAEVVEPESLPTIHYPVSTVASQKLRGRDQRARRALKDREAQEIKALINKLLTETKYQQWQVFKVLSVMYNVADGTVDSLFMGRTFANLKMAEWPIDFMLSKAKEKLKALYGAGL